MVNLQWLDFLSVEIMVIWHADTKHVNMIFHSFTVIQSFKNVIVKTNCLIN